MNHRRSWTVASLTLAVAVASLAGAWTLDTSLSDADLTLHGETLFDYLGTSVTPAGDFNADGYDDLLVSAPFNDEAGSTAGKTYLVLGTDGGFITSLSDADATFLGESPYDESGTSLASAGDVNGDGFGDVLLGAVNSDRGGNNAGAAYLVHGSVGGWSPGMDLGTVATVYEGEHTQDHAGSSVAGAGDVDGDGFDDFLVGADGSDDNGPSTGEAYLVLGGVTLTLMVDLETVGASWVGELNWDMAGSQVAGAGDVDGDGYDDMLVSATGSDAGGNYSGQVYLILGRASGWTSDTLLATADASFVGEASNDYAGEAVAGVGDVDGDGLDDFVVGAWGSDVGGTDAGQTYLVLGRTTGWTFGTDLGAADASFVGEVAGDGSGGAVASAGDVNDDGLGDLLVGAPGSDAAGTDAGQIYVVLGQLGGGWGLGASLSGSSASFLGETADDLAGSAVAGVGDFDGDGYDDILMGAPDSNAAGSDAGQVYLVLGTGLCVDRDGDGFGSPGSPECPSGAMDDCDDFDPTTYPGATELCDGLDNNCDGLVVYDEADNDGDGIMYCAGDCNDADASVFPGATELCDGVDNDCDGAVPADEADTDGDGYRICAGDCDDGHVDVHPGATETCDGVDEDCDGALPPDEADDDGDGYMVCEDDCDDTDAGAYPGAPEVCNGLDDDCDDALPADELDNDGDGYRICEDDCDDSSVAAYPGAEEICDGEDNDCDEVVPEDEADADGDGIRVCEDDCDDTLATVYPGAEEICDGEDNDCDGTVLVDETDADGDGWMVCEGDCDDSDAALELDDSDGDDFSTCEGDCDDIDPEIHPEAEEACWDGIDNDCDTLVDYDDLDDCIPSDDDDDDDATPTDDDDDTTEEGEGLGVSSDCECRTGPAGAGRAPWGVLVLVGVMVVRRRSIGPVSPRYQGVHLGPSRRCEAHDRRQEALPLASRPLT